MTAPVQKPRVRALMWAFGLLRHAWLPFSLTIAGRWVGSLIQIAGAALVAFAVAQLNIAPGDSGAVLPQAVTEWLASTNHASAIATTLALVLGVSSGAIDTLVSWAGTWMHVILNRILTPAAIATGLQIHDDADLSVDTSTIIQRWLLKEQLVDFFHSGVATVIGAVGTILIVLTATFRTDNRAGWVCVGCLVFWSTCCVLLIRKAVTASRHAAAQHEEMGRILRSTVAIRRDFGRPSLWRFWLSRTRPSTTDLGKSILWQGIWSATLSGVLGITASSIPLIAVITAVSGGGLQVSIAIYLFTSRLVAPLSEISQAFTMFQDQLVAIQRTHDAFAGALNFETSVPLHAIQSSSLEFDGGALQFNDGALLELPSIQARAGTLTFIVGPSGCGKSSLLAVLSGQRDSTSVVLRVNGDRVELKSLLWRETVGLLPQDPELMPGSVDDNLRFFPNWRSTDRLVQATDAVVATIVGTSKSLVGFDSSTVSAGQRRAIALLRVLGSNLPVILLDEPIAGVDGRLVDYLKAALVEAAAGRIVIAALHEHDLVRLNLPASVINIRPKAIATTT